MFSAIPDDVVDRFPKDEEYKSSLKQFLEMLRDDEGKEILDADTLRKNDTWNELSGKVL